MKFKRKRALEVPPKIRCFINRVAAFPLENIQEPLKNFAWEFDKGDFHHWVDLFNHFDSFFEKYVKPRKDLQIDDGFLDSDPPFPREAVLQILRVIRIILDNCTNKHFYSSYEQHLSSLLSSTDPDVVEATLDTLATFLKKTIGKYSIRDASLNSKLFALAQGWGGKEEGLGLVASAVSNDCDPIAHDLGCALHFEFYAVNESESDKGVEPLVEGLQIIHLNDVHKRVETDLELLHKLVTEYKVPSSLRFSLLTRLRFARAFGSLGSRQQYTCIRLYAFIVLIQACGDADDLVSFFNAEPGFINELISLLSYEDAVLEKIRVLCLHSLAALCQDRSRQPSVLTALTSGGHRGILSSLMQKSINSVISDTSKWSVHFAEALLSLVTVLVSSSSGCSAMREAGFIPTLLPLLKDINPQHLHLVEKAVRILEAFMDYSNPAAALFRDLGGLDDTISRLKIEISHVENGGKQPDENSESSRSAHMVGGSSVCLDDMQPLYSEPLISYHRRSLMKALLRAISLGTYAPGNTTRIYGSEENVLPQCLCIIFRRAKDFGGGVFSLAATVLSDLIQKDPTCFPVLDAAGLPSSFLDAIMDDVLNSSEAITCIPQCLDALCLNSNGLQAVKDRNSLRCFVKVFTSRTYLRALTGDTPASLSSGLDELMRHASSLRGPGVDMLVEILETISKIGSAMDPSSLCQDPCSSTSAPMEMDGGDKNLNLPDSMESSRPDDTEQINEPSSDASTMNIESYLPDCVNNVARLLETILQNADTCRIFVEKKGIEAILQLFTMPLMPPSVSVGQSISVAFKNFSPQHYVSLARDVCSFLREHLKSTNEVLDSTGGTQLSLIESAKQSKVLKHLSSLEGILALSVFLLKGTTAVVSELSTSDADVLKDIGRTYKEIIWQISLCNDSKTEEKKNNDQESDISQGPSSTVVERESDDDTNMQTVRYTNPVFARNGSHSMWSGDRDFVSVVRSGEGLHRRTRQGIARMRGGRAAAARRLEALNIDSEASSSALETSSSQDLKKKSPDVLALEILNKLASTMRSFFTALVKGFTSPNRRRADSGSLSSASKALGTVLATNFLEALSFSGHSTYAGLETSLSVKCRYLGKVVDDMAALTFDSRRRSCYTAMVNNFYVHGTFKELLTTYEATSQLLWTLPCSTPSSDIDLGKKGEVAKLSHNIWLLYTLQCYCRLLEYFVNSSLLLSPTSASQTELLVQPVAVGLSIGLFPVPRDPEVFVRMLQSQVLDVILPVWNHPMFYSCNPGFISSIISLVTHIYSGVGDVKRNRNNILGSTNQRFIPPPPDEATIATIVEMGFSRARAEEALRRVETNSVEMAMEWLFSHADDPVQEDDELARALALSLGSSSETTKVDNVEKTIDVSTEEGHMKKPPVDDILAASVKLFHSSDSVAFQLSDLLVTLCNQNKGEDRPKVLSYLLQQLKLCPLDFSTDNCALGMLAHVITLLLFEDGSTREVAAQNGIISTIIDILTNLKGRPELGKERPVSKCISALLLILDQMLQSRPKTENTEAGSQTGSMPDSSGEHGSLQFPDTVVQEEKKIDGKEKEHCMAFENVLGKSTGFATIDESHKLLDITCDLIKQHVPAVVMQAVLQLCARLTKTHALAMKFLENGGLTALFSLPRNCFFPGYDTVVSAIVRHLLEDPQTLQSAMELEIRQTLSGNRHSGRVSPRSFLTSLAPVISRDPIVFMKAVAAVCQLETSGGRTVVVLSKEKEKEKSKSSSTDATNECLRISESKSHDGSGKYLKSHKKVPVNVTQVIDQLLEIVLKYPPMKGQEDSECESTLMDIDESNMKVKGKSKVEETVTLEPESERSTEMVKVIFVLKLLSDILLMYGHAVGVILRRDSEMCQFRGSNQPSGQSGIIHHVLHRLLSSIDKSAGPGDWRGKLSEKASWFLVVLCGRSGEGRKRVTNGLVKELMSFSNFESNSLKSSLSPDKRLFAFVDLVYSILSKNSSSGSLPGSGYSPEIAKSLIDGGIIKCLTSILQVVDLDHPDAPKFANLVLKGLECLSRAANASEQIFKSDVAEKRRSTGLNERSDDQITAPSVVETVAHDQNASSQEALRETTDNAHHQRTSQDDHHVDNPNQSGEQDMRVEEEEAIAQNPPVELGMDFMREEMGEDGVLHNPEQIEMTFHVENRVDNDMGDEDDDMGDDRDDGDDDDEDDDDGEDEDEDIAEDGGGMMSMADTDVEDHDDSGDEYNNEMFDVDDDDFHENRVIEVRWREALDGLDHLQMQILGQPGTAGGLIDVAAEPFEGVNVDDLFRLQSFERRRQTGRSSFERPASEINGFQHPLFVRPPQSGDFVSMWSSGGTSASRDSEALSSGNPDAAHFYMFDAPILSYDHLSNSLFGDHMGSVAPPPLTDYSVGMGSLHLPGRRVLGNGRWTDDGQPQGGAQAAAIAQAVEGQFLAQMGTIASASSPTEQQVHNSEDQEKQSDALPSHDGPALNVGADSTCQQIAGQEQENGTEIIAQQINLSVDGAPCEEGINVNFGVQDTGEGLQTNEPMSVQPLSLNIMPNGLDCTVNEINVTPSDNVAIPQEFVNSSIESSADVPTNSHNVPVVPMVCKGTSNVDVQPTNPALPGTDFETPNPSDCPASSVYASVDVDMSGVDADGNQSGQPTIFEDRRDEMLSNQNTEVAPNDTQAGQTSANNEASGTSTIDPTFLEALPEDLRAEVLASQQAQSIQPPVYAPPSGEDIDPEFLAALPPDIQAEVLAQQRAQRVAQQAEGHPVDMDNASIIATFPADLREEVLLTSSEAVLSALPSPLLAEAQILRDRAMSHYQARSLFGSSHRLNNRRNGLGFVRRPVMDRGVGVTIDRRSALTDTLKVKEIEGEPLLNANALKSLIRLLRLAQPLGKGLLQRLLLNLCAHSLTRATLIYLLLDMIKPEVEGSVIRPVSLNSQRLYGCHSNTVYGRSQLVDGLPPLVFRRILEILIYLATNHSAIAKMLFHFDQSIIDSSNSSMTPMNGKGKEKVIEGGPSSIPSGTHVGSVPLVFFLKLLNQPLFLRSTAHLEQVMGLIQVIVDTAASKLESQSQSEKAIADTQNLSVDEAEKDPPLVELDSNQQEKHADTKPCHSNGKKNVDMYNVFLQLPQSDLRNVCSLLGREGLSDKMYMLAGEVLKKLAFIVPSHRKFFILELSESSHALTGSAVSDMDMESDVDLDQHDDKAIIWNLNTALEPLWQELSNCISAAEMQLGQSSFCPNMSNINVAENLHGSSTSPPLPPGTQRLLPFIEAFFVLCEKLQANESIMQQDHDNATAREVKESAGCSASVSGKFCGDSQRKLDGGVTFTRFAEKHRRLANAFIRQNPVGNNATFQPNPNSVYQTEHLSYFKFVGRVVGKALFDGQLLDVYFTRSFYKHILGVKVTYHDIEAVDPDYYKNLKWMLENDVSDIPDLTFSMDADEEKLILYEKNEVTDYELKPGGRNIRVTEETKHEYVDLVAEHLLTNAIRPQINSFLEGFSEMVPRELISIFNDKELELLISGLPEIDLDDLKANTEYTGYTVASNVVQWFWEVVKSFNKEDMARLLQFVTGTSKVPLEGFKALQGISGPQRFQIHKAYGAPDRLPSAHTCFNQLDLPEYTSKEQLQDRLLLAIHEASEGSSAIMSLTCHLKIGNHPGCYSVEERFYW
ncbi:E3 ubiquitin-protein ligase UPL1 [Trifolium repens]|nr:E3 ubiquitin-protein ligase UPL1 [Trifolium repens]